MASTAGHGVEATTAVHMQVDETRQQQRLAVAACLRFGDAAVPSTRRDAACLVQQPAADRKPVGVSRLPVNAPPGAAPTEFMPPGVAPTEVIPPGAAPGKVMPPRAASSGVAPAGTALPGIKRAGRAAGRCCLQPSSAEGGAATRNCSLAQAPRSALRQRSLQNGRHLHWRGHRTGPAACRWGRARAVRCCWVRPSYARVPGRSGAQRQLEWRVGAGHTQAGPRHRPS